MVLGHPDPRCCKCSFHTARGREWKGDLRLVRSGTWHLVPEGSRPDGRFLSSLPLADDGFSSLSIIMDSLPGIAFHPPPLTPPKPGDASHESHCRRLAARAKLKGTATRRQSPLVCLYPVTQRRGNRSSKKTGPPSVPIPPSSSP
jgi:hypothetical protein